MKKKVWKKKLYISFLIPVFIIVVLFMGIIGLLSFRAYDNQLTSDMASIVTMINIDKKEGQLNEDIIYKYEVIGKISFIDENGKLITSFDNEIEDDNKLIGREEVQEAMRYEKGSSLRYNEDAREFVFYKAYALGGEIVIIAVPLVARDVLYGYAIGFLLVSGLLTLAISGVLSIYFYKKNIKPMVILEKYIKKTYKQKDIAEVDIQSLPKNLKKIALIFKETSKNMREYAAKEEEQKLYLFSIIDTMEEGFIAVDDANNIKLMNKSALQIFGLDDEEIVGSNLTMKTQNFELAAAVKETREEVNTRVINIDEKTFKLTVYPLGVGKGKLIVLHDITKLNSLENMRKEFVSNVTHELKTPLTAIRGFVETLKDGTIEDPAASVKFLGIIDVESQRLEKLISDLLDLSNIESNKVDRHVETIDIKDVADSAVANFQATADKKKVSLVNDIQEGYKIKGNLELFKALFYNLVSNGIKYNVENGSVTMDIKEIEGGYLLMIKDTGIGISEDDLNRIFERFYKVDKSRSLDTESTGLGLSIVKHILEFFDGDISVESILAEGSTFKVYLPKKED